MRTPAALGAAAASLLAAGALLASPGRPNAATSGGAAPAEAPARVQCLFLGDDRHHRPAERVAEAHAPLFRRGIQLEYTEDLADLNPANLARFDVLVVYANHPELSADQEAALLGFVRGGGGLAALHCASACFTNSAAYLDLVGGQFASHGTGVFTAEVADPEHPVTRGFEPFTSWDETYVHRRLRDDLRLLLTRERAAEEPGGAGLEPWTWLRTEGEGRVFYTASGHDRRTWSKEGFLDLVARGVRWAAGEGDPAALPPPAPFTYVESGAPIPDYASGRPAGASRPMQVPLSPEVSLERLAVAPGLEARLFASEPLLEGKPIHLAFDARGRAWVAETVDYPNERVDEGGRDRIVILEDTDGDGGADRRTVFADGLSIPTAMAFARGGLVVLQAPDALLLRDTDGDDRADVREVLFTGFGTGDTHAGPSNLRTGPDGRLWATVGYSGFRGRVGDQEHRFSQAIFAFQPDGSALEVIASTTNNTWGLGFSEEGSVFASTANGNPSVHAPIPARHYEGVRGLTPGALRTISERMDLHPVTERVRQVDFHGKYTAAAGHALYTARLLPRRYWNRIAFVNSPTGHTVGQFVLEDAGSTHVARDGWNLVASDDEWTAPILTEVGPDGAAWVVDWYNYIVQHNPTPPGFETGRGNAYVTELRDKVRGRIWRVVPEGAEVPLPRRDLEDAGSGALVAALDDDNLLWRSHAQRLLLERGGARAAAELLYRLGEPRVDAVGNDPGALHALWTLAGLGVFGADSPLEEDLALAAEDALVRAMRHPAWGVRRAALEQLPAAEWARDVVLSSGLLDDGQVKVRVAALLALARMPASAEAGAAAFQALAEAGDDRWLAHAATIAGAAHDAGFLTALLASPLAANAEGEAETARANLVPNGSFEDGPQGQATGWQERTYGGRAEHGVVRGVARTGERSLRMSSERGADTSMFCTLELDPDATYSLTAWIKTDGLDRGTGRGAQLNVHEIQGPRPARTEGLDGTEDWRKVEATFEAGGRRRVTLNCLLGGWGWSTGAAYWDDVRVERLRGPLLEGPAGRALPLVMAAYAGRGPVDSVVSTLGALAAAPDALADAVLEGLLDGWPDGAAPALDDADRAALATLAGRLGEGPRSRLAALLGRWGVEQGAVVDVDALAAELAARLGDADAPVDERVAAAERLVALGRTDAAAAALPTLDPSADPALVSGLVRAVGGDPSPAVASAILDAWDRLGPMAQRTAATRLLGRAPWTRALLERMADGAVPNSALDAAQWSQLTQRAAGTELAALVEAARGAAVDPDRAAVVERFAALLPRPADAAKGAEVYRNVCAKCHVLGGMGVAIGPELDGIGARPAEELLIAILDPSRSVEGTYQLWTARTTDGQLVSGRLVSETRTTVELLDSEGTSHLLPRDELELLRASALSVMPAGLEEETGEQGLLDLLAFLAQQH